MILGNLQTAKSNVEWSVSLHSTSDSIPHTCGGFSFEFQLQVAKEVIAQVNRGMPPPEDLLSDSQTDQNEADNPTPLTIESSPGDGRLWAEVLRNLSKDLSKQASVQIPESLLTNRGKRSKTPEHDDPNAPPPLLTRSTEELVAFTCGHSFTHCLFHSKILMEMTERIQDFPNPIPHTLKHLQLHYKQANFYPSACPLCVFQYLRKVQLQECPGVPIRPWNPQLAVIT